MVVLLQEIEEDILSRLPVKSLRRLRCLSKSWDSLITDQSFARMHLKQAVRSPKSSSQRILLTSPPCSPLLSLDYEKDSSFAAEGAISRLDFPAYIDRILVVGSCRGLICVVLKNNVSYHRAVYLWNPSTGDYNNLPDLFHKPYKRKNFFCNQCAFGFGYDSFSDDYKVFFYLQILRTPKMSWAWAHRVRGTDHSEDKVAIFSTRENCWRFIHRLPPSCKQLFGANPRHGSFVNGTLNWLVSHGDSGEFGYRMYYKIVAFDLKTEKFFELPMPDNDIRYGIVLGILEGKLCLSVVGNVDDDDSPPSYPVELWVMNEYGVGQSWTKFLRAPFQSQSLFNFPVCLSKDNQIILDNNGENRLTRINVEGRKLEECNICKSELHDHSEIGPCKATAYLESLVWPYDKS